MGSATSKCYTTKHRMKTMGMRAKIQVLEEQFNEMKRVRELEARAYEQHLAVFLSKEEEWKLERKKHEEEAARVRTRLQEEEGRIRCLKEEVAVSRGETEWHQVGADYLVLHMKEEKARREEAVEKWKQLYLTIKTELDDLIQRTRQGERFCWGAEEGMIERLQQEMKVKEETIEAQRSSIAVLEKEGERKDREIDILRQSLKILSNAKRNRIRKRLPRMLQL